MLRTASEEEVFKKRPKRKVKKRRKSADDRPSSVATDCTNEQKTQDSNTESSVSESVKPRKRRSRREQAALAAKSSRGGKSGYTAANLRRYAAERKPTQGKSTELNLETRSQSTSAIKRAEKGT